MSLLYQKAGKTHGIVQVSQLQDQSTLSICFTSVLYMSAVNRVKM
jgi:hypothetical protein